MTTHDPLDQAFRGGYAGARNGLDRSQCPYALDPGSLDLICCHPPIRRAWLRGWAHGTAKLAQERQDRERGDVQPPSSRPLE